MCPRLPQKSLSPKPSTCTIHSPSSMDSTLPGGSGSHDFNNLSGNNSTNHLGNSGMDNNFSETFIPGTNPASTAMGVHTGNLDSDHHPFNKSNLVLQISHWANFLLCTQPFNSCMTSGPTLTRRSHLRSKHSQLLCKTT